MGSQPSPAALQTSIAASRLSLNAAIDGRPPSGPTDRSSLLRRFDDVFMETTASDDHQIEEAFRLRYQVYCLDRSFEEASACLNGMEQDAYDDYAYHSLLSDKASQRTLGTVRLVKPAATPNWIMKLPLAEYADIDSIEHLIRLPAGTTAEVSRFAISRSARSCLGSPPEGAAAPAKDGGRGWRQKLLPYMSLGLIRGLVRLSMEHGITHWCLAAEPSLLRRLRSFGLYFEDAGPLVEHRGLRQICYAELSSLLRRAKAERADCWRIMTEDGLLTRPESAKTAA